MSAELARRLIHSGAAPAQVEAALFQAVQRGVSLTQAINELYPALLELFERALDRSDFPSIHTVRPLADAVRALPAGMCERLLALPVHRDQRSSRIDVASADVLDGHVASEFAFHLGVPIRILRAPFTELIVAFEALHSAGIFLPGLSKLRSSSGFPSSEPPARPETFDRPSEPPLPLAKKSRAPNSWSPDAPAVSFILPASSQPPSLPRELDDAATEPVLSLRLPKPFSAPVSEPAGPPWSLEFEIAVAGIERAETPEQVVASLCDGLRPVRALVFAVRNTTFDVRGGSTALGTPAELRQISVPAGNGSLLDAATRIGFYLGPFAQLAPLTSLEGKWAAPEGTDCYARTVNVSERPSLVVLMAGFSESTEATRRADVLSRSAGNALDRIVRLRKRV
ncbi:MAG: hypothetical protein ABIQ16_18325 [Polyangiaceae bacterium]